MKIAKSVRKAIDDLQLGDSESAMLHACNAVDGTARRIYPLLGNKARFTRFLRESYEILAPMAMPGHDLHETYFPVTVKQPGIPGGKADIADIVYSIHRCCHGHGDELPDGFSLIRDVAGRKCLTRIAVTQGQVRLSDRIIPGLLAVVVFAPVNKKQARPELNGYRLSYSGYRSTKKLIINEWWGRARHFLAIVAQDPVIEIGGLDFTGMPVPPHKISLDQSEEIRLLDLLNQTED